MQITDIIEGNYQVKHKGFNYVRYVDFGDIPYYIHWNKKLGDLYHNTEMEIDFQKALQVFERKNKLKRIIR